MFKIPEFEYRGFRCNGNVATVQQDDKTHVQIIGSIRRGAHHTHVYADNQVSTLMMSDEEGRAQVGDLLVGDLRRQVDRHFGDPPLPQLLPFTVREFVFDGIVSNITDEEEGFYTFMVKAVRPSKDEGPDDVVSKTLMADRIVLEDGDTRVGFEWALRESLAGQIDLFFEEWDQTEEEAQDIDPTDEGSDA